MEHTTFIMKAVPNEALATCSIERHPSMDPDATCDVQICRKAWAENCSVLEPPAANSDAKDMMEAWHYLWQSLGATENQIQSLILLNVELRMHEEVEEVEIWLPNYPRSLQTVWNGFNEQTMEQIRLRHSRSIADILSSTHRTPWTRARMWTIHGYNSFEDGRKGANTCCPPLPQALSIEGKTLMGIPNLDQLQMWDANSPTEYKNLTSATFAAAPVVVPSNIMIL